MLLHTGAIFNFTYYRSVIHLDKIEDSLWYGIDGFEDSYYLRRNQSFYIHVLNDDAGHEEVKSLFLSNFYGKILNAVALTKNRSPESSFSMWTKSPCDSVAPKLTNVWTEASGFRKGLYMLKVHFVLEFFTDHMHFIIIDHYFQSQHYLWHGYFEGPFMPENQCSNTGLATLQLHHQKSRYELSSITSNTSSK